MLFFVSTWKLRSPWALILLAGFCATSPAHSATIQARSLVVRGWHEWYELKVDPEDAKTLMVCGNGWDSRRNSLYGFVVISHDGGQSWHSTLEHRASTWVSEQSCAFGSNHRAYFVSEASLVIDGVGQHRQGATHLFVSTDAGEHWTDTSETAWTDYSTSSVSSSSGELITFYNRGVREPIQGRGSTIDALIFARDGKLVRGAFFDRRMMEQNYMGNLPSQATSLDDGSVVALYGAPRVTKDGRKYDLGLIRIAPREPDRMHYTQINSTNGACFTTDGHALVYDKRNRKLIVAYSAESAKGCGMAIATSSDFGKTWMQQPLTMSPVSSGRGFDHLALAISGNGAVGLLWEDAGKWFFSTIKDAMLDSPLLELSARPVPTAPDNESLMTFVVQPPEFEPRDSSPRAVISVRSRPAGVMRCSPLVALGDGFEAIVPVIRDGYEGLEAIRISKGGIAKAAEKSPEDDNGERDVTAETVLLWGNTQSFDPATGTLTVDLRLGNRGTRPLRTPIRVQARELSSDAGSVSITNSENGLRGSGAIWDISRSIPGDELLPGSSSYSTFRMTFHIDLRPNAVPTYRFLDLGVSVLASKDPGGG